MEKLQYVGGFAVRCWFLKWNCFFLSLNKAVSWFWDEMVHGGWGCWDKVGKRNFLWLYF